MEGACRCDTCHVRDFAFGSPEEQNWDIIWTMHTFSHYHSHFLFFTSISNYVNSYQSLDDTMKLWNTTASVVTHNTITPTSTKRHKWACNPHSCCSVQGCSKHADCPPNHSQVSFSAALQHHAKTIAVLYRTQTALSLVFFTVCYFICPDITLIIAWHTEGNLFRGNKAF